MGRFDIERAVLASDLSLVERGVMHVLLAHTRRCGVVVEREHSPSLTDLAKQTGAGRSTIARALTKLELGGWIKRDRPDPAQARAEGVPTAYHLAVGSPRERPPRSPRAGLPKGSPRAGLVPERDHPVVPERDGGSPAAGPNTKKNYKELHKENLPTTQALSAQEPTAQGILGAYIDWLRDQGGDRPPPRIVGQLARHIGDMLAAGIPAAKIKTGLADWTGRAQHPATLDSFVNAAMNAHAGPRKAAKQQETDDMFERAMIRARERESNGTNGSGNSGPVRQSLLPAASDR